MRTVVQRVSRAEVRLAAEQTVLGRIDRGLLVLLGIGQGDGTADAAWLVDKIAGLRLFPDPPTEDGADRGNLNRALAALPDIAGMGTRSPALAGAGTAVLEGYDATYVNPAGLYGTPRRLTLGVIYGGYRVDLDGAPRPIDATAGLLIGGGLPLPLG